MEDINFMVSFHDLEYMGFSFNFTDESTFKLGDNPVVESVFYKGREVDQDKLIPLLHYVGMDTEAPFGVEVVIHRQVFNNSVKWGPVYRGTERYDPAWCSTPHCSTEALCNNSRWLDIKYQLRLLRG